VYVAPGLSGVFCVGGYTIAAGARSVGAGIRTAALHEAAVEAVRDRGQWRTRVQLAMLWWPAPWLASMWLLGSLLGPRLMAFLRLVAPVFLVMAVLVSLGRGDGAAAGLGCVILFDAILTRAARSRVVPRAVPRYRRWPACRGAVAQTRVDDPRGLSPRGASVERTTIRGAMIYQQLHDFVDAALWVCGLMFGSLILVWLVRLIRQRAVHRASV